MARVTRCETRILRGPRNELHRDQSRYSKNLHGHSSVSFPVEGSDASSRRKGCFCRISFEETIGQGVEETSASREFISECSPFSRPFLDSRQRRKKKKKRYEKRGGKKKKGDSEAKKERRSVRKGDGAIEALVSRRNANRRLVTSILMRDRFSPSAGQDPETNVTRPFRISDAIKILASFLP